MSSAIALGWRSNLRVNKNVEEHLNEAENNVEGEALQRKVVGDRTLRMYNSLGSTSKKTITPRKRQDHSEDVRRVCALPGTEKSVSS